MDPDDHRRLRQLAAEREQSLTELVREAVGRYISEELRDDLPTMDQMMADLRADPLYAELATGGDRFVDRMAVRAADEPGDGWALDASDQQLGEALLEEHASHRAAWRRRHGSSE